MKQKKYFIKFYYIGKEKYFGSQRQPNVLTIEDKLIEVLKKRNYIDNLSTSEFQVASRTDRYVSARGSVFSILSKKKPILMEINSFLPKEIGLWAIAELKKDTNPRFDAILRWYKYILRYPLSYLREENFDLEIVRKACKELQGTHNFKNFSKRSKNEQKYIRNLNSVLFNERNGFLIFDFKSQGFLRQQIRRMITKLMELGKNQITYGEFLDLFDATNFHSYKPAEPRGLILWDIKYPEIIQNKFIKDKKSILRMKDYFLKKRLDHGLKCELFSILEHNNSR